PLRQRAAALRGCAAIHMADGEPRLCVLESGTRRMNAQTEQELIRADAIGRIFGMRRTGFWNKAAPVRAVVGVSFAIRPGETLGLVGESGSGKSTIGRIMLGMMEPSEGRVFWSGCELARMGRADRAAFRRQVQMIFQDPLGNLDPRIRAVDQVREALDI